MDINNLRILILANDPLARAGLAALLADQLGCDVVGQINGEINILSALNSYQPDVLLCDLGWDPGLMLEALADLEGSRFPLVLLLPNTGFTAEAWDTGARALLLRDADVNQLLAALTAAAAELVTLDPVLAESLLPGPMASTPQLVESLTPRETEVLQHLAEGLANKTIALRLDISEHTVKFHVNAIMSKLGAQSRTEAVVRATQMGLILL